MVQKQYRLSYLPLFYDDLLKAVNYIMLKLKNEQAAEELLNLTEMEIKERLNAPESFEKFQSMKERKHPYYRIYVKNFIVFYVVITDESDSNIAIMEVRRFLYNRRDLEKVL
ncbi:type II toxin-antitoxin system RelE/ParE family toxin [Anaeromicropila populeti]|uniref:ParE toxin of type II toxin-antitoxin system, parDE n=1 Tax=Anaeromicropila populeti TaxID=37658 RepID=A0A1I6ICP2_9FIRM|nr:type II toxin-antitoxin system RelE/ParE family toxin [Anaeromicropila populeti]SFR64463.1 ParE toxin of type II toxin-antitoxin system, parDE [Anaeromicropila populeti]